MKAFTVHNKNVIHQFLKDGVPFEKIRIVDNLKQDDLTKEIVSLANKLNVPVEPVPYQYMEKGRSGNTREVIVAVLQPRNHFSLKGILDDLYARRQPPFFLLLNRVSFASNVGLIARTAFAAGVNALIYQGEESQFFNEDTFHFSMGTIARIPLVKMNIFEALKELRKNGIPTYALEMNGAVYSNQNLKGPVAFVLGEEGEGLSDNVLSRCTGKLSIPMKPGIESLNVGASASIVLYEKVRQDAQKAVIQQQ